jgi:hypothetical protein
MVRGLDGIFLMLQDWLCLGRGELDLLAFTLEIP